MRFLPMLLAFLGITWAFSQTQPASSSKTLKLNVSDTPFAAFQDGDGIWQRLKLGLNQFSIRDSRARFSALVVCSANPKALPPSLTRVWVYKLSLKDTNTLELRCPKPASVTLSGTLENTNSTCVNLHLAGRQSQSCNYQSTFKTAMRYSIAAGLGKFNLFAAPTEPSDGAIMTERLLIARNIKITKSQQLDLDILNTVKLEPKTLSVNTTDSVKLAHVFANYWSNDGSLVGLGGYTSSGTDDAFIPKNVLYGSLPNNLQLPNEHYLFRAVAPANINELYGITGFNAKINHSPGADTVLSLPTAIIAPKISKLGKNPSSAELALEITWNTIENANAYSWRIADNTRDWLMYTSSTYQSSSGLQKDKLPDLSKISGWNRNGDWAFFGIRMSQPLLLEFHAILERKGFTPTAVGALLSQTDADLSLEKAVNGSSLIAAGALLEVKP